MKVNYDELAACMRYLRLDAETADEAVVMECLISAREYLADAGISLPPPDSGRRGRYDLAAHALALTYYERRDPTITGTIVSENPAMRQIITQLKLTEPVVSKLDTDGRA